MSDQQAGVEARQVISKIRDGDGQFGPRYRVTIGGQPTSFRIEKSVPAKYGRNQMWDAFDGDDPECVLFDSTSLTGALGVFETIVNATTHYRATPKSSEGKLLDEALEALRNLVNNAGAMRAFEYEIRAASGNTNRRYLMDAVARADAVLAKAGKAQS